MNLTNVALISSIIAGMLAIPVGSQQVSGDFSNDLYTAGTEMVGGPSNNTSKIPKTITEEKAPDEYSMSLETAFGKVESEITPSGVVQTLEQPDKVITIEKDSESTVWILESGECSLEITKEVDKEVSECETSRGTLTVSTESGETLEFEGIERQKVQQTCEECKSKLKQGINKLKEMISEAGLVPERVRITEINDQSGSNNDYIEVTNLGKLSVSLEGWNLRDKTDGEGNCPLEETLKPGESFKKHIAQNCGIENIETGDEIVLIDSKGEEVDSSG